MSKLTKCFVVIHRNLKLRISRIESHQRLLMTCDMTVLCCQSTESRVLLQCTLSLPLRVPFVLFFSFFFFVLLHELKAETITEF